jgi:hypothetical protein
MAANSTGAARRLLMLSQSNIAERDVHGRYARLAYQTRCRVEQRVSH